MSKRSEPGAAEECIALGAGRPALDSYPNRELSLGSLAISRALPVRDRRLVGPWCFLDRFGPLSFTEGKPMDVAPHPHIGLQTVTWLLDGEVLHDDSLGSQSLLRPGGVNVMTSGAGIAHAEQTPRDHSGRLNGVQAAARPAHARDPTTPAFEHAVLVLDGDCALDGQVIEPHMLHYLGTMRTAADFSSREGARVLLIGGPPFPEAILMWWNFVARTQEEIAQAAADWERHERFGEVRAYHGPRLTAPSLTRFARANPAS